MAVPERWMLANPSAEVDDEPDTDDVTESVEGVVDLMKVLRRSVPPRRSTNDLEFVLRANYPYQPVGGTVWGERTFWTGATFPLYEPFFPGSYVTHDVSIFTAEGASKGFFPELNPTTLQPDEPLLSAVSQATDEQKEQIWRVLGVSETVMIRRRGVEARPQSVSSDWLDEALNVHANPTPISLEDWYADEPE